MTDVVVVDESRVYSILDAWQEKESRSRRLDLRKNERRIFRAKLQIIVLSIGPEAIVRGFCRDISVGGLGFGTRRPFKEDELLAVRLQQRLVLCQVRYCRYISHGMYGVGAMFQNVLEADAATPVPGEWVAWAGGRARLI